MKKVIIITIFFAFTLPLFSYLFDVGETKGNNEVDGVFVSESENQEKIKNAQKLENLKKESSETIKIGLMPFKDLTKKVKADRILHKRMKEMLEKEGFSVSEFRLGRKIRWNENITDFERLSLKYIADIGKKNNFDYMIIGTITKVSAKKKFKLGSLLTFPIGLGNVLYGEVNFRMRVISISEEKEIYSHEFSNKRKNQIGGLYQGDGAVLDRNFKDILEELVEELKPMLK